MWQKPDLSCLSPPPRLEANTSHSGSCLETLGNSLEELSSKLSKAALELRLIISLAKNNKAGVEGGVSPSTYTAFVAIECLA